VPVKDTSILLLLPLSLFSIWKAYLIPVAEWTGEISFHLLRPSAERSGFPIAALLQIVDIQFN
jgi:hypothetical protein